MKILAIETSCDETAVSIINVTQRRVKILAELISSQIKIHQKTGGIVPEVAARKHVTDLPMIIDQAFRRVKVTPKDIDLIAVTNGPGLITSLMVGAETAKNLAYLWQKPLVSVNHLEGHLYSGWLPDKGESWNKIAFPLLTLIASGGHTELVLINKSGQKKRLGQTRDDAAGEAFDKVAKMLGLPYPGGPAIQQTAKGITEDKYDLPRPMINEDNLDFSFAGLKTSVLYKLRDKKITKKVKSELSASFQKAVVEVLVAKFLKAIDDYQPKTVAIAGGVAANVKLRQDLKKQLKNKKGVTLFLPPLRFTTDNATMIGIAAYFKALKKEYTPWENLVVNPRLKIV